jgi:hypothetical protein
VARYRLPLARFLAPIAFVAACGGDASGPRTPAVASIVVSFPGSALSLGATQPLGAAFLDVSGNPIAHVDSVSWSSSNDAVASIDQFGNVKGVALGGPVTFTVRADGKSATTGAVSVIPDHIAFTPSPSTLAVGATLQLAAVPADFFNAPISGALGSVVWSSTNTSIATVDTTGLVRALTPGDVVISATSAGRTSGLQLELGVPADIDGTWSGAATCGEDCNYPLTFSVLFGRIRSFLETTFTVSCPGGAPSLSPVISGVPNAPVEDNQFAFTASAVAISGTFTGASTMTGAQGSTTISTACPVVPGSSVIVILNATVHATTFTATKQ